MPRDKERKATVDKPRFSLNALRAAFTQVGAGSEKERAKLQKEANRLEQLRADAKEGNRFAKKELKRIEKRERDRSAKENRRETSQQLGLGRDSQREPKGKNSEAQRKKNVDEIVSRLKNLPKGPAARNEARALLRSLNRGVATGRVGDTARQTFDGGAAANKYFGASGVAAIRAEAERLAGKSYTGGRERKGVFNVSKDSFTGKRTAEYVGPKKGAGRGNRSKFSQGPKRPRGRPPKQKPQ
jgi:hypothetical protein